MNKSIQELKAKIQKQRDSHLEEINHQTEQIAQTIQHYRDNIDEKIEQSKQVVAWGRTGILILGGVYITFKLAQWILGSNSSSADDSEQEASKEAPVIQQAPSQESSIVREIKSQIASFLLAIAKKELMRLLEEWRKGE